MVGTKFLVQWEEHPSHMATRLGYLLENQILVDVTLMCNTHTLKVHKVVLASCSPYFEGVLQKQLGTHPLIVLKDMKFSVLRSLIEFMYCGETSIAEDNLPALLDAAKFFEVKGLASMNRDAMSAPNNSTTTSSTPGNTSATKPSLLSGNSANKSSLVTNGNVGLNSTAVSTLNDHGTSSSAVGGTNITGNLAISPNFPRARGKITGRGRRSSFINSDPATTILSGANDPASILLSLAKPTTSHSTVSGVGTGGLLTTKMKMSPGSTGVGGRFAGAATANSSSIISNGSLGVGEGLGLAHSEPRRRGRRKLGTTATDPMFDSRTSLDPSKSSSLSHSIKKSPLLASLLVTEQAKKKGTTTLVTDPRYADMLKKAESGNGGNSLTLDPLSATTDPNTIFYETNGSGDLVLSGGPSSASFQTNGTDLVSLDGSGQATFSNGTEGLVLSGGPNQATFLTVLGGEEGGEVTEAVVMQDGTICTAEGNQIAVDAKFVQSPHDPSSSSLPLLSPHTSNSPSDHHPTHHHTISLDSSMTLDSLKHQVSPAPDPEAVVLYEMNEESNSLEKYVISSEEVQALRMLNTLVKQKGMSKRDISHMIMSNDETSNTQIAEIDLVLGGGRGKCKSLIKKILEMGNGLKGTLEKLVATRIPNNNNNELLSSTSSTTDKLVTEEMRDGSHSNCSTSIQDTGGDSSQFLLTGNETTSNSQQQDNGTGDMTSHPSHHEFLIQTNTNSSHHSNDSLTIENGNDDEGDVLMENGTEEEGGGVGGRKEEEEAEEAVERERIKVQNEMSVEMEFKAMMEDGYEVTSGVDTDKVNDEFKLHNEDEEEEDSHSSHSFTSSQKIILSNVLMNSGEDMNILAHMSDPVVGHGGSKDLELLDDDCSQEEYLKSNSYVDEFISGGGGNKRKSTDEENVVPAVKKHKYDSFNHHHHHHINSDGYNHGESQVANLGDDGLNDCNSQET